MVEIQADFDGNTGVYSEIDHALDAAARGQSIEKASSETLPDKPKELTKEEKEAVSWWKTPLQGFSRSVAGLLYSLEVKREESEAVRQYRVAAE